MKQVFFGIYYWIFRNFVYKMTQTNINHKQAITSGFCDEINGVFDATTECLFILYLARRDNWGCYYGYWLLSWAQKQ